MGGGKLRLENMPKVTERGSRGARTPTGSSPVTVESLGLSHHILESYKRVFYDPYVCSEALNVPLRTHPQSGQLQGPLVPGAALWIPPWGPLPSRGLHTTQGTTRWNLGFISLSPLQNSHFTTEECVLEHASQTGRAPMPLLGAAESQPWGHLGGGRSGGASPPVAPAQGPRPHRPSGLRVQAQGGYLR